MSSSELELELELLSAVELELGLLHTALSSSRLLLNSEWSRMGQQRLKGAVSVSCVHLAWHLVTPVAVVDSGPANLSSLLLQSAGAARAVGSYRI